MVEEIETKDYDDIIISEVDYSDTFLILTNQIQIVQSYFDPFQLPLVIPQLHIKLNIAY